MSMKQGTVTGYFVAKCKGGPRDGQIIEHWCKEVYIYRPMIDAWAARSGKPAPIEMMQEGCYHFVEGAGIWRWERG